MTNMNFYAKLIVSLAVVSGIAAGLLAFTYTTTAPVALQKGSYRVIFRYTAMAAGNFAALYSDSIT